MRQKVSGNLIFSINIKTATIFIFLTILCYANSKADEINSGGNVFQNTSQKLDESYIGELFVRVSGNRPFAINGDDEGNIYFVTGDGAGNGTLKKRSTDGTISTIASFHGTFIGPGLEIDEDGYFIIPIGDSVIRVNPNGAVTTLFSSAEMGIKRAINLIKDNQKNIFIVDDLENKLFKVNSEYQASVFIDNFPGSEIPFSMMDACLDKDGRNIYLAESYRSRILKYSIDENGQPGTMKVIYTNQQNANLSNVLIDEEGGIFTVPYDGKIISAITDSGILESSLSGASGVIGSYIANDSTGRKILYLTCSGGIVKVNLSVSTSVGNATEVPNEFYLCQNFPNPFNPCTKIRYSVPEKETGNISGSAFIQLSVYDMMGREVKRVVNDFQKAGEYEVEFNSNNVRGEIAGNFASGIYLYSFKINSYSETKKMIL